jgi:segregation and condensation protein B
VPPDEPRGLDPSARPNSSSASDLPADDQVAPDAEDSAPADAPERGDSDSPDEAASTAAPSEPTADSARPEVEDKSDDDDAGDEDESSATAPRDLALELRTHCRAAIEAMLFSSPDPVSTRKLAQALDVDGVDGRTVRTLVNELAAEYYEQSRGFTIEEVAGGFRMVSHPDQIDQVAALLGSNASAARLSAAALEPLAVVAYKQPVTRADIEAIRGVQAGPLLRTLLQKGLVRIAGRAEIIGRPLLYGTTKQFLEHFGLRSLNELPKVEELPRP